MLYYEMRGWTDLKKFTKVLSLIMAVLTVLACLPVSASASEAEVISNDFITEKSSDEIVISPSYPKIGEPMKITVTGREDEQLLYRWYINDVQINNSSDTYTPVEDDLEKMITVKVYDLNAEQIGVKNVFVSKIPVIYIETADREPVVIKEKQLNATMNIQGNDEFNSEDVLYSGDITIKGRGNSTWNCPKKPYKIKLDSKTNLFGMGKNKHWVLLSNPIDTSNLRNHISYQLSGKMGLDYQDGTWVELILNGKDVGIYYVAEHIRVGSTRTDITDWESVAEDAAKAIYKKNKDVISKDQSDELTDLMTEDLSWTTSDKFVYNGVEYTVSDYYEVPSINGGYLLEFTNLAEDPQFKTTRNVSVEVNTPETISDDMLGYISSYVQAFEDALYADDFCTEYNGQKMRYTDFIDLDSFAKGVLLNEMFQNGDFGYRSLYFYKDTDGKLVYGPLWDMDWCLNINADTWYSNRRTWISRFYQDPVFMKALRDVYWEYRYTDIYDMLKEGGEIDTAYDKIYEASVHNDKIWDCEVCYEENAADYKFRLQDKINWMDTTLATLESSSTFSDMAKSSNVSLAFSNNTLSITTAGIEPTSFGVYVNGEFNQSITDLSELSNINVEATDDDIITVVAYSDSAVLGGNYICNQNYITKLSAAKKPAKLSYSAGDELDLSGLILKATYKDGTTAYINPDMVYTKVTDSLDTQLYCYNKVTDKCGSVVLVLACGPKSVSIPLTVIPKEDYTLVEQYINKIPTDSEEDEFVKLTAEAWEQYEALSESAKAKVSNYQILSDAISTLNASESAVIDCYHSAATRDSSRNNLIIAVKAPANTVTFSYGNDSSKTTFKRNSTSNKLIGLKRLGDIEFWTVRRGLDAAEAEYTAAVQYSDGTSYTATGPTAPLFNPAKNFSDVAYPACIFENEEFNITFNYSDKVSEVKLTEDGETLIETEDFSDGIICSFAEAGNHSVTLYYMCGGRWFEYKSFDLFAREAVEEDTVYYNNFSSDEEDFVLFTGTDIDEVKLVSDTDTIELTATESNGYKIWKGSKPADGSYSVFIGEAKEFSIQPDEEKTFFVNGKVEKDSFTACITDAYGNTVKTTDFEIESVDTTAAGSQTVTATYKDLSASCTIEIETAEISSVKIQYYPEKTEFYLFEKFNDTGLGLKVEYTDGSSKYVFAEDDASVKTELDTKGLFKNAKILTRLGERTVNVKYKGFETSYTINVSFSLLFIIKAVFNAVKNVIISK